jgi:hypothetical protein
MRTAVRRTPAAGRTRPPRRARWPALSRAGWPALRLARWPAWRRAPGLAAGLGLGLLALGPGLRRGFLLSYDMVFVPREPFTAAMFGLTGGPPRAVPSDAVIAAASRIVPADVVQKLVLLSIFVLACSGAAALLRREHWLARLAAGVFYAWNPFVAERLLIGQWALLLGYAGLPWVLRAVTRGSVASWRGAGRLGLALLPAAVGGFAAMTISALALVPAALLARPSAPEPAPAPAPEPAPAPAPEPAPAPARGPVGATAVALLVLAVGSLPWLIPSVLHRVYADPAGVAAFAARADTPFGSLGSLLMLGGAWNAQTVPAGYGGAWSACWLALVVVAAAGYVILAARPRRWPGLGVAAVAGLVIAGIGVTGAGQDVLRDAIRLWAGFAVLRDGQQFVAPLALAEATGFGLAVAWGMKPHARTLPRGADSRPAAASRAAASRAASSRAAGRPADRPGLAIAVAALLAPVLLLPGLAWGAAGRLRPVWYPAGWLAAARLIDESRAPGGAAVLPWAAYRRPAWNGGEAMLDPWPRLLSRPVLWNDGVQVGNRHLASDDPDARRLDGVIGSPGPLTRALQRAGVRFVIVDAGPPVRARLPGCTPLVSEPGLDVCELPQDR